jgi:hypothetical protein
MTDHTCQECGAIVPCDAKRHNKRGKGAHYGDQIRTLSATHREVLDLLEDRVAYSYDSGMTVADITFAVNTLRSASGMKSLRDKSVSGRLSELQGMVPPRVSCVPAEVTLADVMTMRFENLNVPRWYLVPQRPLFEQPIPRSTKSKKS